GACSSAAGSGCSSRRRCGPRRAPTEPRRSRPPGRPHRPGRRRRPAPPRETAGQPEPLNILAIDQGTSATKALLVGPGREVLGTGEVPVSSVRAVGADGVEADPEELYRSVIGAGSRALAAAGAPADPV